MVVRWEELMAYRRRPEERTAEKEEQTEEKEERTEEKEEQTAEKVARQE